MKRILWLMMLSILITLIPAHVYAQDNTQFLLPRAYVLNNVRWEGQRFNNCGPATITNALSYFGYTENQTRAADWLKPNGEDKNVSPWQMVDFVNTQVPELPVYAYQRAGGTLEMLKLLVSNNFPVIIEAGYDPEPDRLGWMGHYLLMIGYDDSVGVFITHDSYIGPNTHYTYAHVQQFWQHFNYTYIVLFPTTREAELNLLLGDNLDEYQNTMNALTIARNEAVLDNTDAFAWFNMGTNFVRLAELELALGNTAVSQERYQNAAVAYDQARGNGLPWRMLWYQFGPYEAYYHVGRYDDMVELARSNLADGGGDEVEETYYYGGLAREAMGDYERAMSNYVAAVQFNPNFTPAVEAQANLENRMGGG